MKWREEGWGGGGGEAVSLSPAFASGTLYILMRWGVVNSQKSLIVWLETSTDVVRS